MVWTGLDVPKMTIPIYKIPRFIQQNLKGFRKILSKPRHKHMERYVTGLIVAESANIDEINGMYVTRNHQSSLNRFLTKSAWNEREINNQRLTLFEQKLGWCSNGYVIIDDSLSHKTGKHMDGVGWYYDHNNGNYVLAHNIVTTHYADERANIPIDYAIYFKKEECEDRQFKTKIDLAIDQLRYTKERCIAVSTALLDGWYLCKKLIDEIRALGLNWVSLAKRNRKIKRGDEWTNVRDMIDGVLKSDYTKIKIRGKNYWVHEEIVILSKIGEVKIVLSREESRDRVIALVTNRLDWSKEKIVHAYSVRWKIETFYRDAKQHLGLEDYQLRNVKGIVRHLCLVSLAHTLLVLGKRSSLVEVVKQKLRTIGDMCRLVKDLILKSFIEWITTRTPTKSVLCKIFKVVNA